jgi:hypothetical protein
MDLSHALKTPNPFPICDPGLKYRVNTFRLSRKMNMTMAMDRIFILLLHAPYVSVSWLLPR